MQINNTIFNCELYQILDEVDAQRSLYGLSPFKKRRDSDKDIMVCCPYHNERRPSAGIRKSDGLFHCFACGETHTLPELISHCFEKYDDVVGSFGWTWLLKNFATIAVEERKEIELHINRNSSLNSESSISSNNNSNSMVNRYVSKEELDNYRYYHPYMYKRGLTNEVIELFDIGYDKDTDCITFPVRDARGNTLFIARRSTKTKYFNYPEGVEKPLYGLYEYLHNKDMVVDWYNNQIDFKTWDSNTVIVCESMLDALSFWRIGKFAVALNGTGSELQFKQLRELPCRKLILCTDADKAGMKARQKIRDNVKNKLISEYILPIGRKDANECTDEELKNLKEVF